MAQYVKTEDGYKGLEESISAVTDGKMYSKMDKTNPTGTGSFSMNRKAGTVIGKNSHAEGDDTTASGYSSHAEGIDTTASGYSSHAEGNYTDASGDYSHAEGGSNKASGKYSHAEGNGTKASGYNSHAEGYQTTASEQGSHAEGYSTNRFSSVVTTTNPTTDDIITAWKTKKFSVAKGDYSHVEGKDSLSLNNYSHAEGNQTTASGFNSHAEGTNTKATSTNDSTTITFDPEKGYYTHAEGFGTVAYGRCSHAEGNGTKASGNDSHSEGYGTVAYGTCSHAEGDGTKASGTSSHVEGYKTTASGGYSHAEGSYTIASGGYSHAQGIFNIEDTSNIYADIIGNGTSDTARSNAATVDWNGNAWYAGDVYVGSTSGTNKDEGSKKLATEEYVNNSIAAGGTDISLGLTSAAVGQTIKVKAIDESGKPTAWEAANMPMGKEDFEFIRAINITESTNAISISTDENGNSFSLKGVFIYCSDSIGKGLDYKTISYSDNNGITVTIPNALNASRVTKIKAENDGGIYSLYGGWAGEDKGTINRYEVVTDSPFTPITSIKITFGAAVSQGSVKVWGKK